jgi:transposase
MPYWPRDRYLELAPAYWPRTREGLHPAGLAFELGHVTVPPASPDTAEQSSTG